MIFIIIIIRPRRCVTYSVASHLSVGRSVGLLVCLVFGCIVEKRLDVSSCRFGWWVGLDERIMYYMRFEMPRPEGAFWQSWGCGTAHYNEQGIIGVTV